jgi:cytochrome c biogenesis protein CcdA/thiol-disulfide isomerase/thioredoxin
LILIVLAYIGGVLTIAGPCILPVLPFVFTAADRPFIRWGLPLLAGMALTFAAVATLATVGGGWAVHANEYGRDGALVLLTLFGLTLLFGSLADRMMRPVVALGGRLSRLAGSGTGNSGGIGAALLLGCATGLLWAPCAGPILGLILTSAAIKGATVATTGLLIAYAAGAGTSLAAVLLIGGRLFAAMKQSLGVGEWVRRGLGLAVLLGVAAIFFGLDTGVLTRLSLAPTTTAEQFFVNKAGLSQATQSHLVPGSDLPAEGPMPSLAGAVAWLNSPPLSGRQLRGKVVLIDFWTYSCINCLRSLPYIRAWNEKYKDHGLVIIGVHSPEFAFEKELSNVQRAVRDLDISYPVAVDSNLQIWQAFNNEYWPAHYLIDGQGEIRYHHFGEGEYDESERVTQTLLAEAGYRDVPSGIVNPRASGVQSAADDDDLQSTETYIGYARAENFVSAVTHDEPQTYAVPAAVELDQWGLVGTWTVGAERAVLDRAPGKIVFRFHARDLHLVLGPPPDGKAVRFRVTIDGAPPGPAHGADTNAQGEGTVTEQRLYQLVRQAGPVSDRTFQIEFLDAGVQAFSFTFG